MRAVVLVLAGCGFSGSPSNGNPGGGDGSIAIDGSTTDDGSTQIDAAIDGPPADTDGDMVADDSDNCPSVANADQRDFDEDTRGDACDPCPHLDAAGADDDAEGDGIGVGCDPRPDSMDQRLLWTSFHDASTIADWTFAAGTWVIDNGRLRQTDSDIDFGLASPPLGANLPRVLIATRYTLGTLGPLGNGVDSAGLGAASANSSGQYYACIVSKSVLDTRLYAAADWPGGGSSDDLQSVVWPGTFTNGSSISLVHDTLVNNRCAASQGGSSVTRTSGRGTGLDGVLYLYTQRASGSFDYMFVVGIGT